MITIYGKFKNSRIVQEDGNSILAYPYGIDYKKIDGKSGYFQMKPANTVTEQEEKYNIIINWILDDET